MMTNTTQVTGTSTHSPASKSKEQLLKGYRATFYACFASMALVAVVGLVGLKRAGRVGVKKD